MEQILEALKEMNLNRGLAILAVFGFGVFAMVKVFGHMKDGFGPFNVRITGIVIVATLASILAVLSPTVRERSYRGLGCHRRILVWLRIKDLIE